MISEKSKQVLETFLVNLPESSREMFREIAEFAIDLGYLPKKTKSKDYVIDFIKNKVKRTVLKLEVHDNGIKTNGPGIRMKFYATAEYSDIFRNGVKRVIEEFGGKYTGCYGCGKCKYELEGYTYVYDDGKKVFRCGNELIAITGIGEQHIPEIKELLKTQDSFFQRGMSL